MIGRTTTLGEMCAAIVDCEHKSAPVTPVGDYWAVGTAAMRGGRIDYSAARRISAETFRDWTRRLTPRFGDILLAREAPVGPVARIPTAENVAPGQRTVLLRPAAHVDSGYLFALLRSAPVQALLQARSEGSTVPHLNVPDIRGLALPAPPTLAEQRLIAETLGALEERIESNRRQVALSLDILDALTSALAQGVKGETTIDEIAEASRDAFDPRSLGDELFDHFSIPAFDATQLPERVPGGVVVSNKLILREPSVLVSRLNPKTNRTWFAVPELAVWAGCSTEFLVLTPRDGVSLGALWLAVRDEVFRDSLAQRATGTSGSHQRVRAGDVLATRVPDVRAFPRERLDQANTLLALVHQRRVESARVEASRDALLPELLSGRIRVSEATQAVDSALT